MNNNDAVINNYYGRLEDLILLFKIPMDMRKNLLEICRQFGHAASKSFANPNISFFFLLD